MKMFFVTLLVCSSFAQVQCSLKERIEKVNEKISSVKQDVKSGNGLSGDAMEACAVRSCDNGDCKK